MLEAVLRAAGGGASYASLIALDAPVAWWRLTETAAPFADMMSTPADLSKAGTPTLNLSGPPGIAGGKSIKINANADYLYNTAATKITGATDYSIEFWFYQASLSAGNQCLFMPNSGYRFYAGLGGPTGTTRAPLLALYDGTWTGVSGNSILPSAGVWHHYVGTYRTSGDPSGNYYMRLYVDGVQIASGVIRALPAGTGVRIGQYVTAGYFVTAGVQLAEPAFYNKVLTPAQILAHYNAGK